MYDPLGLSIGTSNLVAVRSGKPPVSRRAVLTLFPDRAPELGVPAPDPDGADTGTLLTGFVERVGGSNTLTSADGSKHDPALLLVEALDALITETGGDAWTAESFNITIAVPAHWEPQALRGLQDALCTHAGFVRGGMSPRLVSDSTTALTALNSDDRLPADGVVALLDFGGGGTSITLADAASGFTPIADTVRYPEFSGDLLDQALMVHVLENVGRGKGIDPASTGVVGQFGDLREECRRAKERLSDETETELIVKLPGQRSTVQVSRTEFESLVETRLSGALSAFDDMLRRSRVRRRDIAAVAMAGGCAKIPLVAQRLSDHTKASVVTAVQPSLAMAVGAVMLSARQPIERQEDEPESTTMAAMVGAATGSFTASTDALGASTGTFGVPTGGAFLDDPSETLHQLAWSEADDSANEPVAYTGEPYDDDARSTPSQLMQLPRFEPLEQPRRGSRLPQLVLGVAALVSMVAISGVAFSLTSSTSHPAPPAPAPTSRSVAPPPSTAPSATVAPPPVTSEAPPPPPTSEPAATVAPPVTSEAPPPPPPPVTTTYQPPPSTTQQATSTTPPPPSTTPTTTPTTAPPPPSTTVSTSPSEVMTTTYLKLPFVPVPIPVQVPEGQGGATPQQPANPYQPQSPYQPQNPYQPQYPYGGGYGGGGYGY